MIKTTEDKSSSQGKALVTFKSNMSQLVRTGVFEGEEHLIAPVVMITVGVHNDVYYSAEELATFAEAWNGVPIPVYHPEKYGINVSANLPDVLESRVVGKIFNARYEDGKLKAEAWINKRKANEIDPLVLIYLENDYPMEVSTGMFQEEELTIGVWNTEKYTSIARNIRPDHLALLPEGIGACSWKDGGGLPRINMKSDKLSAFTEKVIGLITCKWLDTNKNEPIVDNDSSDEELTGPVKGETQMDERTTLVDSLVATEAWNNEDRETLGKLSLEVLQGMVPQAEVTEQDEVTDNETEAPVEAPEVPETNEEAPEVPPEVTPEVPETNEVQTNDEVSLESYIASAPEAFRTILEDSLRTHHDQRKALIAGLKDNGVFTEDELDAKSLKDLKQLTDLAGLGTDSGSFEGRAAHNSEQEAAKNDGMAPPMPAIDFSKK